MALTTQQRNLKKEYLEKLDADLDVDKDMIVDCLKNYLIPEVDYTDKVCLDLGANVGGFSRIAIDQGAYMAFAVECNPRNVAKMQSTFYDELKFKLIDAAVSGTDDEELSFYIADTSKKAHCSSSLIKRRGSGWGNPNQVTVKNINIKTLLEAYRPDIVKIDIEGAEYGIIEQVLEYSPDFLFIELHAGAMKELMEPTLQMLRDHYETYNIEPVIVFKTVAGYDCWFKK